jgi:uncharacterized protein YdbL (DUF1318 family)
VFKEYGLSDNLDENLAFDLDCKGLSGEYTSFFMCENCTENELSAICHHCFKKEHGNVKDLKEENMKHKDHESRTVINFGVCKYSMINLYKKTGEIKRAVEEVNKKESELL